MFKPRLKPIQKVTEKTRVATNCKDSDSGVRWSSRDDTTCVIIFTWHLSLGTFGTQIMHPKCRSRDANVGVNPVNFTPTQNMNGGWACNMCYRVLDEGE